MPRYYFLLRRGQVTELDEAGIELGDLVEAAEEAARRALEYRGEGKRKDHLPKSDAHSTGLEVSLRGNVGRQIRVGTLP
jgi:hypothetical protein